MARIRYTLLILCTICGTHHAVAQSEQLNSLWQTAEQQYTDKRYDEAAETYRQLLSFGSSADLYYNYANALFKSGETGPAILYYERALRLNPTDEDIRFNLQYANNAKTDQIEEIKPFFMKQFSLSIEQLMTSNEWAYTGIISFAVMLTLVLVYLFSKLRWLRKSAFFTALFALLLTVTSISYTFASKRRSLQHTDAIVMSGSVSVKSSPDASGTEVFVIHEGTKVSIRSTIGEWKEIKVADGNLGWIPAADIEII